MKSNAFAMQSVCVCGSSLFFTFLLLPLSWASEFAAPLASTYSASESWLGILPLAIEADWFTACSSSSDEFLSRAEWLWLSLRSKRSRHKGVQLLYGIHSSAVRVYCRCCTCWFRHSCFLPSFVSLWPRSGVWVVVQCLKPREGSGGVFRISGEDRTCPVQPTHCVQTWNWYIGKLSMHLSASYLVLGRKKLMTRRNDQYTSRRYT